MTEKLGFRGRHPHWWGGGKETLGLGIAEVVSSAVSLGVMAVADDLAPKLISSASKRLSKICVEPYLDTIERTIKKSCKLEECQPDLNKSREERAEQLARTMVKFSAAWAAHVIAKMGVRALTNKAFHIEYPKHVPNGKSWFADNVLYRDYGRFGQLTPHDVKVAKWDEGMHIGSLLLINIGLAKHTDRMIGATSRMLQKQLGWSEKRAKDVAAMTMIWELPNLLGLVAGTGVIANSHHKASKLTHVERLAADAASKHWDVPIP